MAAVSGSRSVAAGSGWYPEQIGKTIIIEPKHKTPKVAQKPPMSWARAIQSPSTRSMQSISGGPSFIS